MITSLLHPYTLHIHQPTGYTRNADGESVQAFETRPWENVNLQDSGSAETRGNREEIKQRFRASGPLAQWITEGDQVTLDGQDYRVDGPPIHFAGGALDHTELYIITWR